MSSKGSGGGQGDSGEAKILQVLSAQEQAEANWELLPTILQKFISGNDDEKEAQLKKISLAMTLDQSDEWAGLLAHIRGLEDDFPINNGDEKLEVMKVALRNAFRFYAKIAFGGGSALRDVAVGTRSDNGGFAQ